MNIIVCVKQVPDTTDIKWTKNNTILREGLDSIINPYDEFALETALFIKDNTEKSHITTISMGPQQATSTLKETLSKGADEAYLVCDKKFAASDTVATATTIAEAIKNNIKEFDLIICGQMATDGDTAQTGPGIAENLNLPQVTYVKKITSISENQLIVEKETDFGTETIKLNLPALICVQSSQNIPRQAKIDGYIFAQETKINIINFEDTKLNEEQVGIKGSPTYVSKAFRPEINRKNENINIEDLAEFLKKEVTF